MENVHPVSYSGDKPYVFVSYAHKDAEVVVPLVQAMQNDGYRIWFDMGIEVGTEWSNDIAAHLRDCTLFVAFTSKNSVKSENCLDEIAYAKSHQKPALMAFLEEDVVLPEGTEMQTARFQRMYYNRIGSVEGFMASVNNSTFFAPCREEQQEEGTVAPSVEPAPQPVAAPVVPASQPVAEQPAANKSKKGLFIGLIAAISAVAVACVLLFTGVFSSVDPVCGEFTMDGEEYQLPMSLNELLEDGWTTDENLDVTLTGLAGSGLDMESTYEVNLTRNGRYISVSCYNNSSEAVSVRNSKVYGVAFTGAIEELAGVYVAPEVELAGGITLRSTKEDIIAAYGEATFVSNGNLVYGDDVNALMNGSEILNQDTNLVMFTFNDQGTLAMAILFNLDI